MKRLLTIILALVLCLSMASCGGKGPSGALKLCVDGAAFNETSTMAAAFMEEYPGIQVEVELLPQLRLDYDENYMPVIDTDSQAQREAALQQHRTALMAGSADADLYLITGGISQFHEMNGGTLVQDPYDLMTAGVLADLSALLDKLDRKDYLGGVFEAGQLDDAQYLVPLRVMLNCVIVDASDGVVFPTEQAEFLELMLEQYAQEVDESGLGSPMAVQAASHPVVNKATLTISLYDDAYTAAIASAKELRDAIRQTPKVGKDIAEALETDTLLKAGSDPLLYGTYLGQQLELLGTTAELACEPIPNDLGGVTVEISAFAFAPATSTNQEAAVTFLGWLLSKQGQDGSIPIFSGLGGGYPVRKGCAGDILKNVPSYALGRDQIGDGFLDSLTRYEDRVTHGKFATKYDMELLTTIQGWLGGHVEDLDGALAALYDGWALYLDE